MYRTDARLQPSYWGRAVEAVLGQGWKMDDGLVGGKIRFSRRVGAHHAFILLDPEPLQRYVERYVNAPDAMIQLLVKELDIIWGREPRDIYPAPGSVCQNKSTDDGVSS